MNEILKLDAVCKRFEQFSLENISFSLPEGFIMGLIGHNGAGKTTTINLILDLLARDSGEIELFGTPLEQTSREMMGQVGMVSDTTYFVEDWNAKDVSKAMRLFYKNWDEATYLRMLSRFSLPQGKKIKEFSRGMQTKLMLAAAFSHDARLLILDEPTSGMDPLARDELLEHLLEFVQDGRRSVLFSTHITTDLERVADYITFIRAGKLFFTGTTEELLDAYRVIKGGVGELDGALRQKIIGLREHRTGFDGLVHTRDTGALDGFVLDRASIDDIMVYTGKEGSL